MRKEQDNQSSIVNRHSQTIVSLDPSSTVVGFAVMGFDKRLIEAGPITPAAPSAGSYERIVSLRGQLRTVLESVGPATILIEWTTGKVGKRHYGNGAGLAVYGCGVGAIATECEHYGESRGDCEVVPVLENDWTRGVPKRDRQYAVATEYRAYLIADDPGGDVADAIGLALWWLKRKSLFSWKGEK